MRIGGSGLDVLLCCRQRCNARRERLHCDGKAHHVHLLATHNLQSVATRMHGDATRAVKQRKRTVNFDTAMRCSFRNVVLVRYTAYLTRTWTNA